MISHWVDKPLGEPLEDPIVPETSPCDGTLELPESMWPGENGTSLSPWTV